MWEDKAALRRYFLARRAAEPDGVRRTVGVQIARQLLTHPIYRAANCIFIYAATAQEIATQPVIAHALARDKTVCVPLCGAQGQMTARRIRSISELHPGKYGIPEPSDDAEEVLPEEICLVVAPALACDRQGYRLGYGGGYYDRFLCKTNAVSAVLCAEVRLVSHLPHDELDRRCQWVVTERQVLRTDEEQ